MPIYEYQCIENNHRFEAIQKITDNPLKSCKICNSPVNRLISPSSFQLKGGGWYSDNYSGSSNQSAPAKPSKPPSGGTNSSSS